MENVSILTREISLLQVIMIFVPTCGARGLVVSTAVMCLCMCPFRFPGNIFYFAYEIQSDFTLSFTFISVIRNIFSR